MRSKPYTQIGIRRMSCCRCGQPATCQWKICADQTYRPLCMECDIALNTLVLMFLRDPDRAQKITKYQKRLVETKPN